MKGVATPAMHFMSKENKPPLYRLGVRLRYQLLSYIIFSVASASDFAMAATLVRS